MSCPAENIKRTYYDYGTLPPHIISKILSQLATDEFRNASAVCKSWYYASFDPCVTKNIRVNFTYRLTNCDVFVRPINNAGIYEITRKRMHYRKILRRFGSRITEVELYSKITAAILFELFIYLPSVQSLKICSDYSKRVSPANLYRSRSLTRYKNVIIQNLAQIKKIEVRTGVRTLELYRLFLSYCTNVEVLCWHDDAEITKDRTDFLFNFLLNPTDFPALYKVVELKLDSIDCKQNSQFFEKMIKLELSNIKHLTINEISSTYYDTMFNEFCKTYHFLESLNLTGCNKQHLVDICKYMRNIKSLALNECTANNFSQLLNLKHLEQLIIHRVYVMLNDDLQVLMSSEHKFLKQLSIGDIDFTILKLICENCKNLVDLSIIQLTTKDCEPIFRNLTKLKKLSLQFTEPVTINSSLIRNSEQYNIMNLSELEEIFINSYVSGITPELIKQLPKLRKVWNDIKNPLDGDLGNNRNYPGANLDDVVGNVIYEISDFNFYLELMH